MGRMRDAAGKSNDKRMAESTKNRLSPDSAPPAQELVNLRFAVAS